MTGIALASPDPRAAHAEMQGKKVDVDGELMGAMARCPSCSSSVITMATSS
jgi:hypothetical protein